MALFKDLENRDNQKYTMMLERYVQLEADFEEARAALTFKGKTVNEANNDQAQWPMYVDERLGELKTICKKLEVTVELVRGTVTRELKGSAMDLGRELTRYVDRDDRYLDIQERFLLFDGLREQYAALSQAWTTRGYALRNKVDLLVHQIKDNLM
jgi:hypothetical protein